MTLKLVNTNFHSTLTLREENMNFIYRPLTNLARHIFMPVPNKDLDFEHEEEISIGGLHL